MNTHPRLNTDALPAALLDLLLAPPAGPADTLGARIVRLARSAAAVHAAEAARDGLDAAHARTEARR